MKVNFLIFIFIVLNISVMGQALTGIVVDEYRQAIHEVNILNISTDHHTHSDKEGKFIFEKIVVGDTLLFSHIGYQTEVVEVTDLENRLNITLNTSSVDLEEIVISPMLDALNLIAEIDIQINPVNSSQEVLRKVPGLFIGQHAGGGKAEQLFLRGFDIDHGTDISLTVDGLPVNMVSHAHGQGYADLHFLIPETIEKIDFGKGPYYENKGNFNTAGYVNFITKQKLEKNTLKFEAGQFDTYRMLAMFNLVKSNNHNAYIATEFLASDGPFDSPQNFNRINMLGKYTGAISSTDKLSVNTSYFSSKWDASGQIPQRAVDSGLISRFGAIDDTEGGITSRTNFLVNYDKIFNNNASLKSGVFLSQYNFELYSNFTFFLEDPVNGDQIKQKENRTIYGLFSEYKQSFASNNFNGTWQAGISLRNDQSTNNELSHTLNRKETLDRIQLGDINETNFGAYVGTTLNFNKWTFNPAIRLDYFNFQYNDALLSTYQTQAERKSIISPKFNIIYNQSNEFQLYLKTGKGFHSNDTRVVVAENGKQILPAAYGSDLGFIWKPSPKMLFNLAYWNLYLEQEFVYVGDAGIVEPSGKTFRQGVDLSYRYQPFNWLFWNFDANYTYARATEEADSENFIPLAPDFTLVSSINLLHPSGWYGSVNFRYLDNRPANEDNSIVVEGYAITDLNVGYKKNKLNVGVQIQNVFNTEWNETQFATESRLFDEAEPTEEIHFTPGSPFFLKTTISYFF